MSSNFNVSLMGKSCKWNLNESAVIYKLRIVSKMANTAIVVHNNSTERFVCPSQGTFE